MVDIPDPLPGLVIRYSYLWRDEQRRGQDEGRKDRPCAVVLAVTQAGGTTRAAVAAITHTPPEAGSSALPLPPLAAKRLGLDEVPQWIITAEVNLFTWPGPDIRPAPGANPPSIAYGHLPHRLARQMIEAVRQHVRQGSFASVRRDD